MGGHVSSPIPSPNSSNSYRDPVLDHSVLRPYPSHNNPVAFDDDSENHVGNNTFPHTAAIGPDRILKWPVFGLQYRYESLQDHLFLSSEPTATERGPELCHLSQPSQGNLDQAPQLVDNFLGNVHTKNPILDIKMIRASARRLAEDGPGWDAASCLVVCFACYAHSGHLDSVSCPW